MTYTVSTSPDGLDELDRMGLPPLWSQEELNPIIQIRLVAGGNEWYVVEGSRQQDDYRFYGFQVESLPIRRHFLLSEVCRAGAALDDSPRGKRWSQIRA